MNWKGEKDMDDRQIIELYFARDEKAIAETSQKYGIYCFTIANGILQSDQDAEECVNDTWLRTWNSIPPQKPNCFRLFLAKIARNLALDKCKERSRQKRGDETVLLALDEIGDFLPASESVETRAEEEELMRLINCFLHSLSERNCNIFINRYFHIESAKTIADKYDLTEGNVQKILFRVRNKLKHYLESEGYTI